MEKLICFTINSTGPFILEMSIDRIRSAPVQADRAFALFDSSADEADRHV